MEKVFVWRWLPGVEHPLCAGQLTQTGKLQDGDEVLAFQYLPSYLETPGATSIFAPDLPLQHAELDPSLPFTGRGAVGLSGPLRDASPDFWGRRVTNALAGLPEDAVLPEMQYLLAASGTNRIGALDFQLSSARYVAQDDAASLEEIMELTSRVINGKEIPDALMPAVRCATGIGGWRPKALWHDGERQRIAKFEHPVDLRPMVQMEAVSMLLAPYAGIPSEVGVEVIDAGEHGKVMLIDRFDRVSTSSAAGERKQIVSMRSAVGLSELGQGSITYPRIADSVRSGPWAQPDETLRQLFRRLVYSILVSNKDDHLRNTAAFWDGSQLELTPAFDIAPQSRMTVESDQFPGITRDGRRASKLSLCREAAHEFGVTGDEAEGIIAEVIAAIRTNWDHVCDQALLTQAERDGLMGREFLNPYAFA